MYTLPKIDWDAEFKREQRLMKEMEVNGGFNDITDDENDYDSELTLEEAWAIYNDISLRKDAKFTDSELKKFILR